MSDAASSLRRLFRYRGLIRLIGAHDAVGARLAEHAGFDGVWASGLELATSFCVPDASILTMTEHLAAAESMCRSVSVPVVVDCDTGYGGSLNAAYMVRRFEAAGVAGICIEDKVFPKINSFASGEQRLESIQEFGCKILAAKQAQRSDDFIVVARVEALIAGCDMEEALERAYAYVEAGADAILIHSKSRTPRQVAEFLDRWDQRAPIVVVPTSYYEVTARELEEMGAKMVIYANHGIRSALQAMEATFIEILRTGSTATVEPSLWSLKQLFDMQEPLEPARAGRVEGEGDGLPSVASCPPKALIGGER